MVYRSQLEESHVMKQTGAALIVSLVLLVLVTLLGVAGIQSVALEEKMAGNAYDRNIAFQAAEAALRVGESIAEANKEGFPDDSDPCPPVSAVDNCTGGLCPPPDINCPPRWKAPGFTGWVDAVSLGELAGTPQYFVEYLGNTFPCTKGASSSSDPNNCKRYRITARSRPGAGRATVILQSVYATD